MTIYTRNHETDRKINMKKKVNSFLWILPLILVAAFLIIAALDIAGLRSTALQLIRGNSAPSPEPVSEIEAEKKKLEDEKKRLQLWEQKLIEEQERLALKEENLAAMEEEARQLNEEAEAIKAQLSAQVNELMEVVALYEKMDAERAARILELLEDRNLAAAVLKNMKKEKASAVLEEMKPESAAEFTKLMLK